MRVVHTTPGPSSLPQDRPLRSHGTRIRRERFALLLVLSFAVAQTLDPGDAEQHRHQAVAPILGNSTVSMPPVAVKLGALPLYFIENRGQVDTHVAYYVHGRNTVLYFTAKGMTVMLSETRPHRTTDTRLRPVPLRAPADTAKQQRWVLKLDFIGANPLVQPYGVDQTDARVSYFTGSQEQWQTEMPTYSSIVYPALWPGIDLVYSGTASQLKYTFVVKPGADPSRIKLAYHGATGVTLTHTGQIEVRTPVGSFREERPYVYQVHEGQQQVIPAAYTLDNDPTTETSVYSFQLGDYDPHKELIIDPVVLLYAGYIGGGGDDFGYGIAVDNAGNAYVTGATLSAQSTFPTVVGPDPTHNGGFDAFVAKINPTGTALVYAGYIGSSNDDIGWSIAVDNTGNAYITGETSSTQTSFPVIGGPDTTFNGGVYDAFVAKLNAAGTALLYAGYIGGDADDLGYSIAVDSTGNAYITGETSSTQTTFPVTGGPDLTHSGGFYDAFVAKINTAGTALVYSGFIGGEGRDASYSIAVDSAGNAYVTGQTSSTQGFPVTTGPDLIYNDNGNFYDAFVAKVNAAGTALLYCGYVGGNSFDVGWGIAVDSAGNAYIAGETSSTQTTFPVMSGPDLTHNGGSYDAFVAKVNASGTAFVYSGYIGGDGNDFAYGIAVDSMGNAYITGETSSTQTTFPVVEGPDLTHNGGSYDAFVAKINPNGTALLYAGYIGGSGIDVGNGITVDGAGNAYVVGETSSPQSTFPVIGGPDVAFNGSVDTFVAKVAASTVTPLAVFRPSSQSHWFFDTTQHGSTTFSVTYGTSTDIPVPGDYNGDESPDLAVFRPSTGQWFIDTNRDGISNFIISYGTNGDIPVPGDYNGDGLTDVAVWRRSQGRWFIDTNRNGTTDIAVTYGTNGDIPAPGDYNGDAITDLAVFRPSAGRWFIDTDHNGVTNLSVTYGTNGDLPVAGDYDGDGMTDLAVFRPSQGQWFVDISRNGVTDLSVTYGLSTDIPVPNDYDGDGQTDFAVWRPSQGRWFIDTDRNGVTNLSVAYGASTDKPLRPNGWVLTTLGLLPQ